MLTWPVLNLFLKRYIVTRPGSAQDNDSNVNSTTLDYQKSVALKHKLV